MKKFTKFGSFLIFNKQIKQIDHNKIKITSVDNRKDDNVTAGSK